MPLDDHARVQRLRAHPRTDRSFEERVYRFAEALQTRLGKALASLDDEAALHGETWERTDGRGRVLRVTDGAVFGRGVVAVSSGEEAGAAGCVTRMRLVLSPRLGRVPAAAFGLHHVRVGDDPFAASGHRFGGGAALLGGAEEDRAGFRAAWAAADARHQETPVVRQDLDAPADEVRLRFGPLASDPEGAFHALRRLGRAFPAAYFPLAEQRVAAGSGPSGRAELEALAARLDAVSRALGPVRPAEGGEALR